MTRVSAAGALATLREMIAAGVEYPDAEAAVALDLDLSDAQVAALREAYDEDQRGGDR